MSTGLQPPSRLSQYFSTTAKFAILAWLIVLVAVGIFLQLPGSFGKSAQDKSSAAPTSSTAQPSSAQTSNDALASQVGRLNQDSDKLSQRLDSMEKTLGGYDAQFRRLEETASQLPSRQALERANMLGLATQVKSTRPRLHKLKTMQTEWEVKIASLLQGDAGRRIVGSPTHLDLVTGLLDRERPTAEQLVQWESQLEQLGAPLEQAAQDEKAKISIVPEHAQQLTDLIQQVVKSLAELERQQLLLDAVSKETEKAAPGTETLEEVLRKRRTAFEQDRAKQIADAKAQAEKSQTERLATLEKEAVEADTRRKELKQQAEQAQADQLAKIEAEQIAEESRIKEAKQRAVVAGLKDEVLRLEEATRQAQLEQEFQQDLPNIKTYLCAYTEPGYAHRQDNTKGPVSLSYLKGLGALKPGLPGLTKLLSVASASSDRPKGALPHYIGGDLRNGNINTEPVEKAQQLLLKYGDLMVKKGMLAP